MTAKDVTGFCASSIRPEIEQFSPHFGPMSLLNCTENLEKQEKHLSTGENSRTNPVETAPRNCRFLSLIVVQRVLITFRAFVSHICLVRENLCVSASDMRCLSLTKFGHFPARKMVAGKLASPLGKLPDFLLRDRHSLLEWKTFLRIVLCTKVWGYFSH